MRKDNKGQQKTLECEMFPQALPHPKNGRETKTRNEHCDPDRITDVTLQDSEFSSHRFLDLNPDGSKYEKPTLDEIWRWFGET